MKLNNVIHSNELYSSGNSMTRLSNVNQATNDNMLTKILSKQADIRDETIHPPDFLYGRIYKIKTIKVIRTTIFIPNAPDRDSLPVKNAADPARQAIIICRISLKK